jgi:hypothetical protein
MKSFILVLAGAIVLAGQTLIDLKTQTKRVDFSGAQSTKPVRTGSALPPVCGVGEMYLQLRGVVGSSLYICVATNIWVPQSALPEGVAGGLLVNRGDGTYDWQKLSGDVTGGLEATVTGLQGRPVSDTLPSNGDTLTWDSSTSEWIAKASSGSVAVQVDGAASGARSTHNYLTGMGMTIAAADTGSAIQLQHAADTAVMQTRANAQSGSDSVVTLTSASGSTFIGHMTPTIVQYTGGMVVQFRPNQGCSGNPVLDIDTLGVRGMYEADGVSPLMCEADQQYAIWYDAGSSRWRKYSTLPAQSSNAGKYLTTNGATAAWADALPSQSANGGKYLTTNGTTASWTALSSTSVLGVTIDGGGSTIAAGGKGYLVVPFDCTLTNWSLVADQPGSIVMDVWKSAGIPTLANAITASAKPTLSSSQLAVAQPTTGWTADVSAGDVIAFNVDSAATIRRATLTMTCRRQQ